MVSRGHIDRIDGISQADHVVRSVLVRNTFAKMNFSTKTKDLKDYVKNAGVFHYDLLTDKIFAAWYAQHRDSYESSMAGLSRATRITMLLREFNRNGHYPYSSYFQPMDSADLTYEKMIGKLGSVVAENSSPFNLTIREDENVHHFVGFVNQLCTSFRFGSLEENQIVFIFILDLSSPCYAEILLRLPSLFRKEPDIKKLHCRPASARLLLTARDPPPIRQLSEEYQKQSLPRCRICEESRYRRNCPVEYFNEGEPKQQGSINSDEAELRSTLAPISNAVQPRILMTCKAIFLEKMIFKECYVIDQNINLVGLDWIDGLNLIQFINANKTCQTFTPEPTNAENLMRGCNQCQRVAKIPYPSVCIQTPKLTTLVPLKVRHTLRVGGLVYALNHHLNHQSTAAMIAKRHCGNIYDVKTGKDTWFRYHKRFRLREFGLSNDKGY
ncbi:hypothetical protein ACTXT7_000890 [Hymenolepis weldensis]